MNGTLALQNYKFHCFVDTQIIKDNASWTSNVLDVTGLDGVTVLFRVGATDITMAALKVQTSETTSSGTALSGTVTDVVDFATTTGLALPTADADATFMAIYIPISGAQGVKRYINLVATAGNGDAGTYLTAYGICSPIQTPNTAAERGLAQQLVLRA